MRATLEQLKAMDDAELRLHWSRGLFPFESIEHGCGKCLTEHAEFENDRNYSCGHEGMTANVLLLGEEFRYRPSGEALRQHLEELYALRLFYDSLYPPSDETHSPTDTVAESCISTEVVEKVGRENAGR